MSNRRLKQEGLLVRFKGERAKLEDTAKMYLGEIEDGTFYVDTPLALNPNQIVNAAVGLKETLAQAARVQGRIDELEEELGL